MLTIKSSFSYCKSSSLQNFEIFKAKCLIGQKNYVGNLVEQFTLNITNKVSIFAISCLELEMIVKSYYLGVFKGYIYEFNLISYSYLPIIEFLIWNGSTLWVY